MKMLMNYIDNEFDERLYDRDNGVGAAPRAIASIKQN